MCFIGGGLLLFYNRQAIVDKVMYWQFTPSTEIEALTNRTTLSQTGIFYFYVTHPSLEDASSFNQKCGRAEQSTAILGCYNGRNIFIYNIANDKLDGIKEVTAAHEMLHAAYDRLDEQRRRHINELLAVEYEKLKDDEAFKERMAFYDRTEPGQRDNELHSIIGTEVVSVSGELETYYATYFTERAKVVALHAQYATVFEDIQKRGTELSNELAALREKIETASAEYNKNITQLSEAIARFNDQAKTGEFTSAQEFNAARSALIARSNTLEARRVTIDTDVARYDQLRSELLSLNMESEALNKSIDSSLAPAPSL